MRNQNPEDQSDPSRLHQNPCKFWKSGKCNWGWSCRFLHGATVDEDPRRPEYRGPPVDFTQFPRPIISSPHFSVSSPIHNEDQSRVKPYRNPCVEIITSAPNLKSQLPNIKDNLMRSCIDILYSTAPCMTINGVKDYIKNRNETGAPMSDFIVYVDLTGLIIFPGEISTSSMNAGNVIQNSWDIRNNNLGLEQLELMTNAELEQIVMKVAPDIFENIEETIQNLQNETADALASSSTNCKFSREQLLDLRNKLQQFFGKLNLVNSMIADLPIYLNAEPMQGQVIHDCPPPPGGLSRSAQKVLSYLIGKSLSQVHMCLSHVNKLLGEFKQMKTLFAPPVSTSAGMHPTPLCAPVCSTICGEEQAPRADYGRRLEPEVAVDMPTQYQLSFRNRFDAGYSPFGPRRY